MVCPAICQKFDYMFLMFTATHLRCGDDFIANFLENIPGKGL